MENIKKFFHIFKSPALSLLLHWVRPIRGRLALICVLTVASTLLSLTATLVTRELIDHAISADVDQLWLYGVLFAVITLTVRGLRILSAALSLTTGVLFQKQLQGNMMQELLTCEYANLKKYHSGELVNRVFSDVTVIKNGLMNLLPKAISMLISFVGAVIILWGMDPSLVGIMLIVGILGTGIMLLMRKPMKTRHKRMQQAESRLHASVQETLQNIRLIKASLSEKSILSRVFREQNALEKEQKKQGFFSLGMSNGMGFMFDISYLVCMLWGCVCIFRGELTYGALAAMIQLIGRIQGPIAGAADLAAQLYAVIASSERLQQLLSLPRENDETPVRFFDSIHAENVSFVYDDGTEEVLRNISFTINKGDFAALTGISGGGKTSLFQLLLGIYQPTQGKMIFDTQVGAVPASRRTRGLFAYVPQGNTLLSGTLRENLTLFCPDASEEQIMQAARAACIEPLIAQAGLSAVIGERGIGLSEGQAQRVAVARALLSEAPILLLDEATSALDDETEAQLLKNIAMMKNKTCLIVTHRKAALAICDRCFQLKNGTLTQGESKL